MISILASERYRKLEQLFMFSGVGSSNHFRLDQIHDRKQITDANPWFDVISKAHGSITTAVKSSSLALK